MESIGATKKNTNKGGRHVPYLRSSLGTPFFQGISIFPREISSFSLGKIRIHWENNVSKLALKRMINNRGQIE
jgi:hypothetical protein